MTAADRAKAAEVRAANADERGEGICRTCLAPIWNEGGTVGHRKRAEGWSDRIERGGDSLVCFKAIEYRHVPLTGREAAIYDHAYALGAAARADVEARWVARVQGLAEELDREAVGTRQSASKLPVGNNTRSAALGGAIGKKAAAARLRGLTTSSEEQQ